MIAIGFALAGTLTIEDRLERWAFVELLRTLGSSCSVPFDEPLAVRLADDLFPAHRVEHHACSHALVEAVAAFLGESLPFAVVVSRFRQLAAMHAADAVQVAPQTRVFLERIASLNVPSAILCNGWSTIAQRKAACTGLTAPVLVSEDIGAAKPSPAAFEALIAALALPPESIWYVGNEPADIEGARRAGLQAVWLNRDDAPYPADLAAPARTIRSLDEILPEVCQEYTRSLLGLRYVLHSALSWRAGHFVPGVEYGLNDPATLPPVL
jgi:FMN phosphatase YigB (HAD superfamily)